MAIGLISFLAMLIGSLLIDGLVLPRCRGCRQWQGSLIHGLALSAIFGLFLASIGSPIGSALLGIALMALLMVASNAKYGMLGEPLVFSDLALLIWVFRHPRFYLTALSPRQRWALGVGAPILALLLVGSFIHRWAPHLAGIVLLAGSATGLLVVLRPGFCGLPQRPDIELDLSRFGLISSLLVYWMRWREMADPADCASNDRAHPDRPELILVVQCESFADPVALVADRNLALPGLEYARSVAWKWGNLSVSGFGAYTMRTEYGVLFGRDEAALGFRQFDPFLTALGETSYALPARLKPLGYHSLFVHPHDMRFYARDRLMPAAGFDTLIGEESFSPPHIEGARYVSDEKLGAGLADLINGSSEPTLIYSVTMENHGPWIRDPNTGSHGGLPAYLHHLANSDAMLSRLIEVVSHAGRPAMLVFFGDHRPSIPGSIVPGGDRHTPYVVMRFSADGQPISGSGQTVDITPDALHHTMLDCVFDGRT